MYLLLHIFNLYWFISKCISCISSPSPACRGCCSALSPRWWRSCCHDWVSSSSWISSVSPGTTERVTWAWWCHHGEPQSLVCFWKMSQQYLHHPHLHFNTTLIHHTDASTGTRDEGRRGRNATVQRYATGRDRKRGIEYTLNTKY